MVSPNSSWKPLIRRHETFARFQQKSLVGLMRQSDAQLGRKFRDPLHYDLMMQAVLSPAREEAYSAALAWSFGQLTIGEVLDTLRIQDLTFRGREWRRSFDWTYDTEVIVPEGHKGQAGRIDLSLEFQNRLVAVVEIKTREYSEHDAAKHRGYSRWAADRTDTDIAMIFIATKDLETDLHGFQFLNWSDVTAGLRKHASQVIKRKAYPIAAMYLSFIGAVEQNLLGFGLPQSLTLKHLCARRITCELYWRGKW